MYCRLASSMKNDIKGDVMKKLNQDEMKNVSGGQQASECDALIWMADTFGIDRFSMYRAMSLEQLMGCTV